MSDQNDQTAKIAKNAKNVKIKISGIGYPVPPVYDTANGSLKKIE